jgi:hypothetical protein
VSPRSFPSSRSLSNFLGAHTRTELKFCQQMAEGAGSVLNATIQMMDLGAICQSLTARVTQQVNVVTIVAWAGAGKSTLVNHRLTIIVLQSLFLVGPYIDSAAVQRLRPQMNSLTLLSTSLGNPDPRLGTALEKDERLAKLVAHRRTLSVLDG